MPSSGGRIRDVARHAGVAISSVSRVLTGHPDVSPEMRERVMDAVVAVGYEPDLLAKGMRSRETQTAGFVVSDVSNPLLAQIAMGAERVLRDAGYSMLLTTSENDPALDAHHIGLLRQRRVDGLLLSLAAEDDERSIDELRRFRGPTVLIDRELPTNVGASAILSDHATGMRAAVNELLALGHTRIALVLGRPLRYSRERRRGLEDAYRERGVEPTYRVLDGTNTPEHGASVASELLADPQPPTALIAGANQILAGIIETLRAHGLRPGSDISLVSCDEIDLTRLYEPAIAVVRRDNYGLGRVAAETLLGQLSEIRRHDGDAAPVQLVGETIVLPTEFVARPSITRPVPLPGS